MSSTGDETMSHVDKTLGLLRVAIVTKEKERKQYESEIHLVRREWDQKEEKALKG